MRGKLDARTRYNTKGPSKKGVRIIYSCPTGSLNMVHVNSLTLCPTSMYVVNDKFKIVRLVSNKQSIISN